MVTINQQVIIVASDGASEEFKSKVKAMGEVALTVLDRSSMGVCTLLLPRGVSIQGHSHPIPSGSFYEGHEYLDLHESHLMPV